MTEGSNSGGGEAESRQGLGKGKGYRGHWTAANVLSAKETGFGRLDSDQVEKSTFLGIFWTVAKPISFAGNI